jgi:ketosteroid isomerase-like protein
VATRWTVRGTHTVDFVHPALGRAQATGRPIHYSYVVHHRIADGKIVESWDVSDRLTLLLQLGVIAAPGQASG